MSFRKNKEETLADFIRVHGNKYQYPSIPEVPMVIYYIDIICPKHGTFRQTIREHKTGRGCPLCKREKAGETLRLGRAKWIQRFEERHGRGKYDYSKVPEDVKLKDKMAIYCPEHNTTFYQSPEVHWRWGQGCPKCGFIKIRETRKLRLISRREFIKRARAVHGMLYEYTELSPVFSLNDNIIIYCGDHDHVFFCIAQDHLYGKRCPNAT